MSQYKFVRSAPPRPEIPRASRSHSFINTILKQKIYQGTGRNLSGFATIVQVTTGKLGPRITSEWLSQLDFSFRSKDLRFPSRFCDVKRSGKCNKQESQLIGDLPWCEMCRSPSKTSIIRDAREWAEIGR